MGRLREERPVRTNDYPTSDGKPMAETDHHRELMFDLIHTLQDYYAPEPRVYVSGNLLLFYEEGDIRDIAVACGFSYPSVFTRAFKAQFGQSPRAFRQSFRDVQGRLVRPEIARLSAANKRN